MLGVVEGEAQVLELVVNLIAKVVGDELRQGVDGVRAGEVEEAPGHADRENGGGQQGQGGSAYVLAGNAPLGVIGNQLVYGVAEEVGDGEGQSNGGEEAEVSQHQAGRVPPGHAGNSQ